MEESKSTTSAPKDIKVDGVEELQTGRERLPGPEVVEALASHAQARKAPAHPDAL